MLKSDYTGNTLRQPLLKRYMRPELVYMTCFGIVLVAVSASGAEWWDIAGGRLVHTIISQSTHYRSISHILYTSKTCHLTLSASFWTPQHSNQTPLWHGAPLKPWLTWVKCLKHYGCQIMKWTEMYAWGSAAFSCKHGGGGWTRRGHLQPTCEPLFHQNKPSCFATIHHQCMYFIYCQHQRNKNEVIVCRREH